MRILRTLLVLCTLFCFRGEVYADTKPVPITASSWLVADSSGKIIQGENTQQIRSIASISKLVTVMVVLDANQDLDEKIGAYTRQELIQLALIRSDNNAAQQLCQNYPGGEFACIKAMNIRVGILGMTNTKFTEPTGLSVFNTSTAEDLIKLVMTASSYPQIVEAAKTPQGKIKLKKKWFVFNNTNPIIGKRYDFIVSKTGYIRAAGGCIAMMLDTSIGRRIVVVLGSRNTHTRIPEAEFIAGRY